MAHSVELLLDPASESAIREIWQSLAAAGMPSQASVTSPTNRPHITVVAARHITGDVDDALRALPLRFPLPAVIGAPLIFGGPRLTLARLVVPSPALLELHEAVYRISLAHCDGGVFSHCAPGQWTPHVTLGRRFTDEQIGAALAVVNGSGDIGARIVGLRRWDGDQRVDHIVV